MGIWRNIQARGLKDITDFKTVKSYIHWLWIELFGHNVKAKDIISFSEQIVFRTLKCKPCMEAGECVHCHCEIRGKVSSPTASCSNLQWEEIMSPEDWQTYKQDNKINIILL